MCDSAAITVYRGWSTGRCVAIMVPNVARVVRNVIFKDNSSGVYLGTPQRLLLTQKSLRGFRIRVNFGNGGIKKQDQAGLGATCHCNRDVH